MEDQQKIDLFEKLPVPRAVMKLAVPTILSSLVMVLYNLADTYFVGMLNDPIQNAGVALAAPVLLAFNAINNLFGVGSSSMMSRALGRRDYPDVDRAGNPVVRPVPMTQRLKALELLGKRYRLFSDGPAAPEEEELEVRLRVIR